MNAVDSSKIRTREAARLRLTRTVCGVAVLAAALTAAPRAAATGMQGHVYMAECAAEQLPQGRLRSILEAHRSRLVNGGFFPDSGYATADHDQGEIAHWEQFVEGYVQVIRERYQAPYDDPEAAAHVAFLMGLAAHGITDSTFDSLLFARAEQVDHGNMDDFDMTMDALLVRDLPHHFLPELDFDADTLSEVFTTKIPHDVTPKEVSDAMATARAGIGAVTGFLSLDAGNLGKQFPWAAVSYLDPRVPGGYAFGSRVVRRYYEEILRRIDGDTSADGVLIGSYPGEGYPLTTLDRTRVDGRIVLFFGHGLDRSSIDETSVVVLGPGDAVVPAQVSTYRGDRWANVLLVEPLQDWLPSTSYRVIVKSGITTLYGTRPSADIEVTFETCAPATGLDCAMPERPPSPCPLADAAYPPPAAPQDEPPPDDLPKAAAADDGGGCAFGRAGTSGQGALVLATAFGAALARRRRRRHVA
jgi:hypothetical protein